MKLEFIEQRECPLCKSKTGQKLLYQLDRFGVFHCGCGHRFINPVLDDKSMMEIYRSSLTYGEFNPTMVHYYEYDTLNPKSRTFKDFNRTLKEAERLSPGRELLEIGCGTGAFLELAKQSGWIPFGIDSSPENIQKVMQKGIDGVCLDYKDFYSKHQYDCVALWDFVEHPRDPSDLLRKSYEILKPGGLLFIATPNYPNLLTVSAESLFRISGGRIRFPINQFYIPEHTSYFNLKTLTLLLFREHFTLVRFWKTETDLDRYCFTKVTKSALRIAFLVARIIRAQNRIMVFARKN